MSEAMYAPYRTLYVSVYVRVCQRLAVRPHVLRVSTIPLNYVYSPIEHFSDTQMFFSFHYPEIAISKIMVDNAFCLLIFLCIMNLKNIFSIAFCLLEN